MHARLMLPRWFPFQPKARIHYVCDGAGWVIDSEGTYIARGVKAQFGVRATIGTAIEPVRKSVVHFGSQHSFTGGGYRRVHASNQVAVTFFHGDAEDPAFAPSVKVFLRECGRIGRVVVSCRIMRDRMLRWGVPDGKVVMIPIGVDLNVFVPVSSAGRIAARKRFGIQPHQVAIGSFQKDGVGWGDGFEPKLIKGPDVFLDVIDRLRKQCSPFVLLTGPARGFVCRGLERMQVPFHHEHFSRYEEVASCYHALDLYLITAREEGGPKGVMEAMATGVPVVATRVGMAADLVINGITGFLCDSENVDALAASALQVFGNPELRQQLQMNGRSCVLECDFRTVARLHYEKVYAPLMREL